MGIGIKPEAEPNRRVRHLKDIICVRDIAIEYQRESFLDGPSDELLRNWAGAGKYQRNADAANIGAPFHRFCGGRKSEWLRVVMPDHSSYGMRIGGWQLTNISERALNLGSFRRLQGLPESRFRDRQVRPHGQLERFGVSLQGIARDLGSIPSALRSHFRTLGLCLGGFSDGLRCFCLRLCRFSQLMRVSRGTFHFGELASHRMPLQESHHHRAESEERKRSSKPDHPSFGTTYAFPKGIDLAALHLFCFGVCVSASLAIWRWWSFHFRPAVSFQRPAVPFCRPTVLTSAPSL